jgi:8-oxo-dGTP diphosphatase
MNAIVHVAVAVIRNPTGQIFITRRPDYVHQGGLWEFPGGKLEHGESVQDALQREIMEESGISIEESRPLIKIPYQYPDKRVLLDVREVLQYSGEPHGKEGQACEWCNISELHNVSFPAANRSIVSALQLPSTFLVTPEPGPEIDLFLTRLEERIKNGVHWFQLRAKTLAKSEYDVLSKDVCAICEKAGAHAMLRTDVETITELGGAGLHVSAQQLMALSARPVPADLWFSASCHTQAEIEHANSLAVDFIYIGSVNATASHENLVPIGWEEFSRLVDFASMPAYAIGGMGLADSIKSRELGGQGIASISALWDSD